MRFALKIVPAPFFEQTRRIGDMMRQSLRQIGIDASIVNTDLAGYFAAVYRERNFDMTSGVYAYRQDPAISTTVLYSSGTPAGVPFSNQRGYASAEMDGLLREAAAELDAGQAHRALSALPAARDDGPAADPVRRISARLGGEPPPARSPRQSALGGHGLGQHLAGRLIRRRLAQALPIILIILVGNFLLLQLAPGDAVDAYVAGLGGGADAGTDRRAARALGARPAGVGAARAVSLAHARRSISAPPTSTTSRSAC